MRLLVALLAVSGMVGSASAQHRPANHAAAASRHGVAPSLETMQSRFVAAAQANDIKALRAMTAPVMTWYDGQTTASSALFDEVAQCVYTGIGNIISWFCPTHIISVSVEGMEKGRVKLGRGTSVRTAPVPKSAAHE